MIKSASKWIKVFEDPRKLLELAIGLSLLALLTFFAASRFFDPFEMLFLDLRFQWRGARPLPEEIVVVGVDEASLDAFGRWPWPRDHYAKFIDLLNQNSFRPKMLFLDILFEEKDPRFAKGDEELAYRTQDFKGRFFMPYFFEKGLNAIYADRYERHPEKEKRMEEFALPESSSAPEDLETYEKVSLPFLEIAETSQLAFVNTPADPDGRTRRTQLLARYRGRIYPSADLLMALQYWGASVKDVRIERRAIIIGSAATGRHVIPVNAKGELLINYYRSSEFIPAPSFLGVMDAGKAWMQGGVPQQLRAFKDKIVLVGVTALGISDRRTTPFYRYEPGINLHAQALANILQQTFLIRASAFYSCLLLWLLGIAGIFITMFLKINRSLPVVIALILVYFFAGQFLFLKGQWIDFAVQALMLVVVFIAITSFRYFTALEELKRTQEQLIQAAKLASLGEMSAGIAHEFRNILNAVHLNVACITEPNVSAEKMNKYVEMLQKIMKSANSILEGLLLFARQSQSVREPGNLKATLEETLPLLEKEMMRHQIELQTDLDDVSEVAYDRGQISQVVLNMVNNSRDALEGRENKLVKISLKEEPAAVRIDISDNGSGIPPQVLKRLFQPFVTSKPAGKGTGLGLSVCHGIIRNHGGDIKVTTVQGKGTTWHIYLPKS